MFSNRVYYTIKPFVPRRLRLALRRWSAPRIRVAHQDTWPILASAARPPDGWPGWPEGKQFAFVLTHDVEGQRGLDRVADLANLESELGFRSSFNFIPEGSYQTPPALRSKLRAAGFEIGVHDLKHNGKLFHSRAEFTRQASKINRYLNEWGAQGFRAGFMLRNLSWLGDLNINYDASTFDTDPFEPQPDGAGTIFPFWVPRNKNSSGGSDPRGYVELPYTLVQDSTLFLHLQEPNIDIWKLKLDWIAAHGGMVLLDTHPDYMRFTSGPCSAGEYPVRLYRELLLYVKARYSENSWAALPQSLAGWFADSVPVPSPK